MTKVRKRKKNIHLRVTILGHDGPPSLVLVRQILAPVHAHVLELVHQLVLLERVQAAVEAVLLARQHLADLGLRVVVVVSEIIIHLIGNSVCVHVDSPAAPCVSLYELSAKSVSSRGGAPGFCALGWAEPVRGFPLD